MPHRARARARRLPPGAPRARRARRSRRPRGRTARVVAHCRFDERAGDLPARRRAARRRSTGRSSTRATMLGQSKTAHQAEIDAACELIDFLRFNVHFAAAAARRAAGVGAGRCGTSSTYRPLEGFVFAVTPFNFTAIARQPADGAGADGQHRGVEAGGDRAALGVDTSWSCCARPGCPTASSTSCPATGAQIGDAALATPTSRGVHFTGSTGVFHGMWQTVGEQHRAATAPTRASSARPAARTSSSRTRRPTSDALAVAIVRGGFEYQGQKCSAASRVYVPDVAVAEARAAAASSMIARDQGGRRGDFRNFMGAVIDEASFENDRRLHRRREAERDRGRRRRRAPTAARAGSSSPRWSQMRRSEAPADARGDLRAGGDASTSTRTRQWRETLRARRRDLALRAHRRGLRARPRGDRRGALRAAPRGRQLLHQRQADRRGGRPAALRRRARLGHQRQGGQRC